MISHLEKESGGGKEGEWRWKTATDHLAITCFLHFLYLYMLEENPSTFLLLFANRQSYSNKEKMRQQLHDVLPL